MLTMQQAVSKVHWCCHIKSNGYESVFLKDGLKLDTNSVASVYVSILLQMRGLSFIPNEETCTSLA